VTRMRLGRFWVALVMAAALAPTATSDSPIDEVGGPTLRVQPAEPPQPAAEKAGELANDKTPPRPSPLAGSGYIPPPQDTISIRAGAATRGPREDFPTIEALAPDHVALTLEVQPTLWWYLSQQSDTRIDVTLIDDSIDPLIEIVETPPVRAGFHAVRLADHGVSLDRETLYRWYVAIVPDPERHSHDVLASGALKRIEPSAALRDELDAEAADTVYRVLAGNGIWYDALDSLSEQIGRNPSDASLRALRTSLLRQVDLTAAEQ